MTEKYAKDAAKINMQASETREHCNISINASTEAGVVTNFISYFSLNFVTALSYINDTEKGTTANGQTVRFIGQPEHK